MTSSDRPTGSGNAFKIKVGPTHADSSIELNGVSLDDVIRVSFEYNARNRDKSSIKIEIVGEANFEGEFFDRVKWSRRTFTCLLKRDDDSTDVQDASS
ncbi:hypothetical protein NKH99_27815 [Mesorhizobium sp. M0854]|uniref:hypothetical protein n=1 Tax=Mesorhizobium sp. M0854 TaxID=2957013 RepID=UPI003335ABCF